MRFSTTALLALPVLASAADSPFEKYKAKFQNFLSSFGASPPLADTPDAPAAAVPNAATGKAAKGKNVVAPLKVETLTLQNWKDTLYAPVQPAATQPEEWLVLVTGRNKTCYGHCDKLDAAFAESAQKLAALPASQQPHLASVNCDDQGVLCNHWSATAGSLWLFEVLPAPAPLDIYTKRVNTTTVTTQDVVDVWKSVSAANRTEAGWYFFSPDGYFHPTDGKLAKLGLSVPLAYATWALAAIPSWGMMLAVSFVSRTMMNRRMDGMNRGAGAPGAGAGGAPRAAPPGDGRS